MLFRIDICRRGEERRTRERSAARRTAIVALIIGVNIVAAGLFMQSLVATQRCVEATAQRLSVADDAMARVLGESGALTKQQLSLLAARSARMEWSGALESVGRLAIPEVWFSRLSIVDGMPAGGGEIVRGLGIIGNLEAEHREEGIAKLMSFVQLLRTDPKLREDFLEATIVSMEWTSESRGEGLEFEVFCPLRKPDAAEEAYGGSL